MQQFMKHNFNVDKIILACDVIGKSSTPYHKNRASHGLVYFLGEHQYTFDNGETLHVNKNEIIYLPKHSTYGVKTKQGGCFAINFDCTEELLFKPFVFKPKNTAIFEHFKKAKQVWTNKLIGYELKCKAELYNILFTMQEQFSQNYISKSKLNVISPAVEYMHLKYSSSVTIDYLSKLCGITPEYFRKIFKHFYGTSPLVYLNNLRIQHAKELLDSKLYSVTEVASLTGFTDTSHFSRIFKKHTSVSPSKY